MTLVRVAVMQTPPRLEVGTEAWHRLGDHVHRARPDVVLLPELAFGEWISFHPEPRDTLFEGCLESHRSGMERLHELGVGVVLGTRPRLDSGRRYNEAFVWTPSTGAVGVHTKQYFPNEPGYYEARWFSPGHATWEPARAGPLMVGFLICTELWFNEHARRYGRQRAQGIAVPRVVGALTLERWEVAMRMAAIVSGCYLFSSNRCGTAEHGQTFGGRGWIVGPHGRVLAETSDDNPVACAELDLEAVARAQKDYPCYVSDP